MFIWELKKLQWFYLYVHIAECGTRELSSVFVNILVQM